MRLTRYVVPLQTAMCALVALALSTAPALGSQRTWQIERTATGACCGNLLTGVTALNSGDAGGDAWAVGQIHQSASSRVALIEHWIGGRWAQVPGANLGVSNALFGVSAVAANDVFATGDWTQPSGTVLHTLAERYNGSQWVTVPTQDEGTGTNNLYSVSAISARDAYATGGYSADAPPNPNYTDVFPMMERWTGNGWTVVPGPKPADGGFLVNVSAQPVRQDTAAPDTVFAVGWQNVAPDGSSYHALIARWNGTAFVEVPSPDAGPYSELLGVQVLSPTDAWAVGDYYDDSYTNDYPLIEHWNGSSWSIVPPPALPASGPPVSQFLSGVSGTVNDLWAVGAYADSSGTLRPLTLHYDGTAWSYVPSPTTGQYGSVLLKVAVVPGNGMAHAVGETLQDPNGTSTQPLAECYC